MPVRAKGGLGGTRGEGGADAVGVNGVAASVELVQRALVEVIAGDDAELRSGAAKRAATASNRRRMATERVARSPESRRTPRA